MLCSARLCDFSISLSRDNISCSGGDGTCAAANMLTTSSMPASHDQHIKGASIAIQNILKTLIRDHQPTGKDLSFLNVGDGVMLAWVEHGGTFAAADIDADAVTSLGLVEAPEETGG